MTFWYVFGMDLLFFQTFIFIFHLGLITTPHVHYVHMTYVSFFTRSYGQEKSLSYYDLFDFGVLSILRTHPHPHFPLLPPQPHHPYTRHRGPHNTDRSEEGLLQDATCGDPANPDCTAEDYVRPRLEPAKVKLVLPSKKSGQPVGRCYLEPSPDQARFGRQ